MEKLYKGSYLESLVPGRKNLFEKIHTAGLSMSGHGIKFGDKAQYKFNFETGTPEKKDKLEVKGPCEIIARHKKKVGEWELSANWANNPFGFPLGLKYANRKAKKEGEDKEKDVSDVLVMGEYTPCKPFKVHFKFHPLNFLTKVSCMYTQNSLRAVADVRIPKYKMLTAGVLPALNKAEYNIAAAYSTPLGTPSIDYQMKANKAGELQSALIVGFYSDPLMDKKLTAGVEATLPGLSPAAAQVKGSAAYKLSKDTQVKKTLTTSGDVELCVKKDITAHCTLAIGWAGKLKDFADPLGIVAVPTLGFKISMKP